MRYADLHKAFKNGCHTCAPSAWRRVPNVTGDYDLDASIGHSPNKDMAQKLSMYVTSRGYGPRTSYDPYGSKGDD